MFTFSCSTIVFLSIARFRVCQKKLITFDWGSKKTFEFIFGGYIFHILSCFIFSYVCLVFLLSILVFLNCLEMKAHFSTRYFLESFTHFPPRWNAFCDHHYFSRFSALLIGQQFRNSETYAARHSLSSDCRQLMRQSLESSHLDVHPRIVYITHWSS